MEKKIFWAIFMVLGLIADFTLPLMWSLILTLPILVLSWWIAYRSEWLACFSRQFAGRYLICLNPLNLNLNPIRMILLTDTGGFKLIADS